MCQATTTTIPTASSSLKSTTKKISRKSSVARSSKSGKNGAKTSIGNEEGNGDNYEQHVIDQQLSTSSSSPPLGSSHRVGTDLPPSKINFNESREELHLARDMINKHIDDEIDAAITRSMRQLEENYATDADLKDYNDFVQKGDFFGSGSSKIPIPTFPVTSPRPAHSSRPASAPRNSSSLMAAATERPKTATRSRRC